MQARSSTDLLKALTERTAENLRVAESFLALPSDSLHQRPRPDAWNVLECLAHLNKYGDYYIAEIRKQIGATKHKGHQEKFTSSWLGNKFAAGMKPGPKMRKITAMKSARPENFATQPDRPAIDEFIRQQKELLELLHLAKEVDLTKTTTGISITSLIRLRLGDTLRVVIYHNWRHVEQAQRALEAVAVG